MRFGAPPASAGRVLITSGPDGNLWFTESGAIGRLTPTGVVTEFPLSNVYAGPHSITPGPDGNLWFTEPEPDVIGHIAP